VVGEFDLDRAVVGQFGEAIAGDFIHFVEARQMNPIEDPLYSMSRQAWGAPKAICRRSAEVR
jgi:hypothetical protein